MPEHTPFVGYYRTLDGYTVTSRLQIGNLRSVFGFTGTLEENALKIKPAPRTFNSQGIVVNTPRNRPTQSETRALKKSISEQYEEIQRQIDPVIKHLEGSVKNCAFCYQKYKLSENYGFWRCSYHPKPGIDAFKYECCGKEKASNSSTGCTPCDHQSMPLSPYLPWCDKDAVTDFPLSAATKLKVPKESYTVVINDTEMARSKAVIRRTKDIISTN